MAEERVHVVFFELLARSIVAVSGIQCNRLFVEVEGLWDEWQVVRRHGSHSVSAIVKVPRCVLIIFFQSEILGHLLDIACRRTTITVDCWRIVNQIDSVKRDEVVEIMQALLPNVLGL